MFRKLANTHTNNHIKEQSLLKGKVYFEFMHSQSKRPWFSHKNLPRAFITTFNRCRADHYNLAGSLARVRITDNPICQCNEAEENLNHIIWQCKLFNSHREKLIYKLQELKMYLPLNITALIAKPHIKACTVIYSFLKDCNLKI